MLHLGPEALCDFGTIRYSSYLSRPSSALQPQLAAGFDHGRPTGLVFGHSDYTAPWRSAFFWPGCLPIGYSVAGSHNIYAYTDNDPLNLTDPSGKCPWCVAAAVGGLAAGGSAYLSGASWTEIAASTVAGAVLGGTFNAVGVGELVAARFTTAAARAAIGVTSEVTSGATVGSVGNAVGQGAALATGARQEFDSQALLTATLTGAGGGLIPGALSGYALSSGVVLSKSTQIVGILSSQANASVIDAPFQLLSNDALISPSMADVGISNGMMSKGLAGPANPPTGPGK